MNPTNSPPPALRYRLLPLTLLACGVLAVGFQCGPAPNPLPASGSQLFASPQVDPVALSGDGELVYALNTSAGTLSVIQADPPHAELAVIPVGVEPVGLAVQPRLDGDSSDELVFVANHLSDSIAIVSRSQLAVVQTVQGLDAHDVTTTNEPVGVAFAGRERALVTLDEPNQVIALAPDADGIWRIEPVRATLTANAPRALAVSGDRLFVAAFESGNQTEFPSCGPEDPLDFAPGDPLDEGCLYPFTPAVLASLISSPNLGGEVIHDGDVPDRDVFVYDLADLSAPEQVIEGVGTLLYGMAVEDDRVYVTHTDARNHLDGLGSLANRMFENRVSRIDCQARCGLTELVDLDANPFGVPVPTPYGVRASEDGSTLVVTAAGSDGAPGIPDDPQVDVPGLVVLDAFGAVIGHVQTGAIPNGVALRSNLLGAAETAYVLNTGSSTLSVVDVRDPTAPAVTATLPVGTDPAPLPVRQGQIAFNAARASTSGTFSCASCHPNGNTDQLLWTINTVSAPVDASACDNAATPCPEPRSTMPVRGLRDTLPLHWDGSLADPFGGPDGAHPGGDLAPDCDLSMDGEVGCIRHLVDASLGGVMCRQEGGCPTGPSDLPGALTHSERDHMAAFLAAVAFPPSPTRRPTDALGPQAIQGVAEFFGTGCADGACHSLPLTVSTNSPAVGFFDAPSMRGLWDRHLLFSNGILGSEEFLASQDLDPAETGMQEFRSFAAAFPLVFTPIYGVEPEAIWSFFNEMSVGLPALTGRQLSLTPANASDPDLGSDLEQIETAAGAGRITAVARYGEVEWRYREGLWWPTTGAGLTTEDLRSLPVHFGVTLTVTAELPARMSPGGSERQPLIVPLDGPTFFPPLTAGSVETLFFTQQYVDPNATVLVDGALCEACTLVVDGDTAQVTLSPTPPAPGVHILQIQNPESFASNELPIAVVPSALSTQPGNASFPSAPQAD